MKKTFFFLSLILLIFGGYYALNTIGSLNEQITSRFEGRRWELPASQLQEAALGVSKRISSGITPYPAFVQLVRRQLKRDYRDQDLQSEGLSIFTTFDPVIQ